jgi:hypothetical protein
MTDGTLGRARGLNKIADPSDFRGSRGRAARSAVQELDPPPAAAVVPVAVEADPATEAAAAAPLGVPHRAVVPGLQRKRRELSVPVRVADAVAATGINPADLVMRAYRRHGDAIYAGGGGRMMARGRQRLRVSMSDAEFDKLSRLGEARGWNRSETVAVLLTLELLGDDAQPA